MTNVGTYIASRASIPERSATWRRLRDVDGWKITSTWINEAGIGESTDLSAPWVRIEAEIAGSERLVLYIEPGLPAQRCADRSWGRYCSPHPDPRRSARRCA